MSSADIVNAVNRRELGIKHGNFYSVRLLRALEIDPDDGVARVSLVHYNTVGEIDRLAGVLEELL
jgi:selenocysteine lyase/cysteine desulfurase